MGGGRKKARRGMWGEKETMKECEKSKRKSVFPLDLEAENKWEENK